MGTIGMNVNREGHENEKAGRGKNTPRLLPLPWVIVLDLVLIGAGLIVFALFHHVLPRDIQTSGLALPRPTTTRVMTPAATTTTASPTPTTMAAGTTTTAAATPEPTETTIDPDSWTAKFADQFTDGDIIQTETEYRSANLAVTIQQQQRGDAVFYLADVYLSDIEQFRTAFASGVYGRGLTDDVLDIAVENAAILAMSGDYYGIRDQGIVIRNGELYRDVLFDDVLVLYYDGSMETTEARAFDMDRILTEGAWQAWSFGPMLLDQGQPMTTFNSRVDPDNPRSAIGYYEPGHYCFVLVDGRQQGYSNGMTLTELSQLFYDLGCTAAYNLDGGQSAVLTFFDQTVNQPYKGGREISDILYISDLGAN